MLKQCVGVKRTKTLKDVTEVTHVSSSHISIQPFIYSKILIEHLLCANTVLRMKTDKSLHF